MQIVKTYDYCAYLCHQLQFNAYMGGYKIGLELWICTANPFWMFQIQNFQ